MAVTPPPVIPAALRSKAQTAGIQKRAKSNFIMHFFVAFMLKSQLQMFPEL
jgi:hypothetical protein